MLSLHFKQLENKDVVFVISAVLTGELENAPEKIDYGKDI